MKYYIITPAKNEEKYIGLTLESMIHQTLKPEKWIIVDDGSTDGTREVIDRYVKKYDWIEVISADNKAEKKLYGSKVIKAFNIGYNRIKNLDCDFVVKLDADLSFSSEYFNGIANAFSQNSTLGICSGYVVEKESDVAKRASKRTYVPGAIKSVRSKCFKDIGGFAEANGWDGLDQLKALYLGWKVENLPLTVIHHRPVTTEYRSLAFFYNNGIAHYRMGNNLFLAIIRTFLAIPQKPYLLAALSYLRGFMKAAVLNEPKLVDGSLAKFIRAYHYKKILKLKH